MSSRSSTLLDSPSRISASPSGTQSQAAATSDRLLQLMKSIYQTDQQVKYLHLQAEVDTLLQRLQILKQQRLTSVPSDADN
ncbi:MULTISPECIES: hypothetical protein [unclassified Coleofasciculus]|uniref:hypothetical protein n=1 Tax=unclassified Coleofasciculus TaxID=2692782 RepID=UPI0018819000|nr:MULTISPECIES: hypothetical protein [unclassified Coleofasciculus]MBE9129393.1 hypothetical protein [Coleofasciculus sp. LEGE 07081]MBE9152027.1 hypothetical protein [Coleofasciculus sp. LEGE 07092]